MLCEERNALRPFACSFHLLWLLACVASLVPAAEPPRVPWPQSKLIGSPEPPLPFKLEKAFPYEFSGPISLHRIPGSSQYLVLEQAGKIYSFNAARADRQPQMVVDLDADPPAGSQVEGQDRRNVDLFSLAFHPRFAENQFVFVCYITIDKANVTQTHISRFVLSLAAEPQLQLESERSILICEGGGHNGCTLAFGPDQYLYISLGDLEVPTPPDPRDTGQDISDLYASILRIDIDANEEAADGQLNYAIPADNPFVDHPNARPEVYAYGLRNPFRMAFDEVTGDLWVGDVGWEAWEMVYRIRSGGNYGWAIKEGPGDVKPQKPGPTPILPADIALGHSDAASVTGGMVYRGQQVPQLFGKYIFGDWITRRFWAASFDEQRVLETREIAVGGVKPICFETDEQGELLILEYSEANQPGGIYRLVPNTTGRYAPQDFPRTLSATGLYADLRQRRPAAGVASYAINASMWADGAEPEYLLAIPDNQSAHFYQQPQKTFNWFRTKVMLPIGSVLAKTLCFDQRPIETQLSVKDAQGEWQYYSYRWNADATDATLVPAAGETVEWEVSDATGAEIAGTEAAGTVTTGQGSLKRRWVFAARSSCRICHTPWTGETVGFTEMQLRRGRADDSWHALHDSGYIQSDDKCLDDSQFSAVVDPHDPSLPLDRRARSYLHTNCGHCHMNGGNASTVFGLDFDLSLQATQMVDVPPMRGALGLEDADIVAAGQPNASVLWFRMAKAGSGHMPHIGSQQIDVQGLGLIRQWIAQLPADPQRRLWLDTLCGPRLNQANLNDAQRLAAAEQLLGSLEGALELSHALAQGAVQPQLASQIVDLAMRQLPPISELFEPFASEQQLPQRLGERFQASDILSLEGDASRGAKLFSMGLGSCSSCHRAEGIGKDLGPAFAVSAARYKTRDKLLEQIVQPSLSIDDNYQSLSILYENGRVVVGRPVQENDQHLTILNAEGQRLELEKASIEDRRRSPVSMMPEQLLAPLTAQQAADLLAYVLAQAP